MPSPNAILGRPNDRFATVFSSYLLLGTIAARGLQSLLCKDDRIGGSGFAIRRAYGPVRSLPSTAKTTVSVHSPLLQKSLRKCAS